MFLFLYFYDLQGRLTVAALQSGVGRNRKGRLCAADWNDPVKAGRPGAPCRVLLESTLGSLKGVCTAGESAGSR